MAPTPPAPNSSNRPLPPGGRPTPPPTAPSRPTPPPAAPSRPTPPPATADAFAGSDADFLKFLRNGVDRNDNQLIDGAEAKVVGDVGNNNGVAGLAETARALANGKAALYGFQLAKGFADKLAEQIAGGDNWVSAQDMKISDRAKARLDENKDGRISIAELAKGLSEGGLAINGDGITTSDEAKGRFGRPESRPSVPLSPPPVSDRPTPPPVSDRPAPPPVRTFFTMPALFLPATDFGPLPTVRPLPEPAAARQVNMGEVSGDVVQLLLEAGRLRSKNFLGVYSKCDDRGDVEKALKKKNLFVAPDDGSHGDKSVYKTVTSLAGLNSKLAEAQATKLGQLQASENQSYQQRVNAWAQANLEQRASLLPPFQAIYDTDSLNHTLRLVGRREIEELERNVQTAMNVYNQPATKRAIAERWQANPEMDRAEFSRMAHGVVKDQLSRLEAPVAILGNWDDYFRNHAVPGLARVQTDEDLSFNRDVIAQVRVEAARVLDNLVTR